MDMKLTSEIIRFVEERKIGKFGTIGYLAIVYDDAGALKPLVSPRHFRILDDTSLAFDDRFSEHLKDNLKKNRHVSVVFVETLRDAYGYQILGEAEYIQAGELFRAAEKEMEALHLPVRVKGVVRIWVTDFRKFAPE
jgi:hypothetical protein